MTSPRDPSTLLLLQNLQQTVDTQTDQLWLADENQGAFLDALLRFQTTLLLLTNRFDIAERATQIGIESQFSDWTIPHDARFSKVYLRICKEKQTNLHLLRLAFNHLHPNGTLILAGQKDEGVKTIVKHAADLFREVTKTQKHGVAYVAEFKKDGVQNIGRDDIDLTEYHQLRPIGSWRDLAFFSKFGVYGWDKVDRGSELLISTVLEYLNHNEYGVASILDLGCGYGFLSLVSRSIPCQRRVATDNNAAALICTRNNADLYALPLEVVASDCGDRVEGYFDLVLCNPPFHRGFNVESDLTYRFVAAAANKTQKRGIAFFVVNSFIPIESKMSSAFKTCEILMNDGRFKVVALRH